jgi:HAD superfamily hydrolase (TIGR01549 family)
MRPHALCLDLFGTIVFFDISRLPRRLVAAEHKVVTVTGIDELLATVAPRATTSSFLDELARASIEIAREKARDQREVPTRERFRRALLASGATDVAAADAAVTMAERHMATLADAVVCPPDRADVLEQLAARHPLALVSNFDHGPTAHALLARFGLTRYFHAVVVSADIGVLKPAKEIFAAACSRLVADPTECLHVGDSREADILGATAAGMTAVWIGSGEASPAVDCIADLSELPAWLATRYLYA